MKNPRAFAESQTLAQLRKLLRDADYAYRNQKEEEDK